MAAQARLSLHMSKCHIVGNRMPWLKFRNIRCVIVFIGIVFRVTLVRKKVVKNCESSVKALKVFIREVHVHWCAAGVDGASVPCLTIIVSSVSLSAVRSYVLKVFIRGVHNHWLVAGVDGASVPCVVIIVSSVSWSAVPSPFPSTVPYFGSGCCSSSWSTQAGW